MIELSIEFDVGDTQRYLKNVRKQVPFAISQALNDVAFDARKALRAQAMQKLDRPTKFTLNGFRVTKANKYKLEAVVFVEAKRAGYLIWQIKGGVRQAKNKGTGVPVGVRLNKHGNIPGRKKGLVKNQKQFIGVVKGVHGVWQRSGGKRNPKVKLMTAFEKSVSYKARFPFSKIIAGVVKSKVQSHFNRRMAQALRTAK